MKLMVAITVILAAVIASFVLDFGDQVSQSAQAGVKVTDGNVTVISLGSNTEGVYCTATDDEFGGTPEPDASSLATVDDIITGCSGGNVVAVTNEGTETVIRTDV